MSSRNREARKKIYNKVLADHRKHKHARRLQHAANLSVGWTVQVAWGKLQGLVSDPPKKHDVTRGKKGIKIMTDGVTCQSL